MSPKIEKRQGRIFVERESHGYFQGLVHDPAFQATEIWLHKRVHFDPNDNSSAPTVADTLNGVATLIDDTLSIIGDDRYDTQTIPFTFTSWADRESELDEEPDPLRSHLGQSKVPEGHVRIGFADPDEDYGRAGAWFLIAYLSSSRFQELAQVYQRGALERLGFSVRTDIWASELWEHAPCISEGITLYLAPGDHGKDSAVGKLVELSWTEKRVPLAASGATA